MRNPTRTDILASLKAARHALRRLEAAGQENFFKKGQNADRSR